MAEVEPELLYLYIEFNALTFIYYFIHLLMFVNLLPHLEEAAVAEVEPELVVDDAAEARGGFSVPSDSSLKLRKSRIQS